MTINLDGTNTVLGILAGLIAVFAMGFSVLRYVIRAETSELRNNGGSTMKDAVDRMEARTTRIEATSAETARKLAEHVEDSKALVQQGGEEKDRIWDALQKVTDALPVVARSTPPEEMT